MKTTSLKITGGTLRGREVKSPESSATHPMGSRERMALMNSLGPNLKNAVILDAFSGTGAVGLEALSRGAAHVTFVEKNHKTAEILRQNVKNLGLQDQTRIFETDVMKLNFDTKFNFVIADPPYDFFTKLSDEKLVALNRLAALSQDLFILSHSPVFDAHEIDAKLLSTKSYAGARISFYSN